MSVSRKWRSLSVGGLLLLMALTACQAIEPSANSKEKPIAPSEEAAPPPTPTSLPVQIEAADPPPLPLGLTGEDFAFKGDPNAPVVIVEFSDYQ